MFELQQPSKYTLVSYSSFKIQVRHHLLFLVVRPCFCLLNSAAARLHVEAASPAALSLIPRKTALPSDVPSMLFTKELSVGCLPSWILNSFKNSSLGYYGPYYVVDPQTPLNKVVYPNWFSGFTKRALFCSKNPKSRLLFFGVGVYNLTKQLLRKMCLRKKGLR